jgi:hypothetical protein
MPRLILLLIAGVLSGCGTTIYSLRVPLHEGAQVAPADAANIIIDDQRPASELKTHVGGGLWHCERWYGDDTYQPSKLQYLEQLLAERAQGASVRVRLERFDTIEYCENTANRAAASAVAGATGASGVPIYVPVKDIPGGDSLLVRLVGNINDIPFDVSRGFDYQDLKYGFTEMPAANSEYRERLRRALAEIVDEIAAKIPASGS